jgi:hypothetical protein
VLFIILWLEERIAVFQPWWAIHFSYWGLGFFFLAGLFIGPFFVAVPERKWHGRREWKKTGDDKA